MKDVSADDLNWAAMLRRKRELNEWLKPATAELWLKLYKEGKLPQFAAAQISLEDMRLASF